MGSSYRVSRKVRLTKAYTIESRSLKYLVGTDTVLLDCNNNVLVADHLHKKHWWENSYIQGSLILIAVLGLILTII